jgi:hypothetical protein
MSEDRAKRVTATIAAILGCAILFIAIWFGCRGGIEPLASPWTLFDFPQGLTVTSKEQLTAQLEEPQFRTLFTYYVDQEGRKVNIDLEVTGFRGTLDPVKGEKTVMVVAKNSGTGDLKTAPIFDLAAVGSNESILELRLQGTMVEISPQYRVIINPERPVLPKKYVQDLFYADKVSMDASSVRGFRVKGSGGDNKMLVTEELSSDFKSKLSQQFENVLFGSYQSASELKITRQPKQMSWSAGSTADFNFNGASETLRVVATNLAAQTLGVEILSHRETMKKGDWIILDERGHSALRVMDVDVPGKSVAIELMEIEAPGNLGVDARFKDPKRQEIPPSPISMKVFDAEDYFDELERQKMPGFQKQHLTNLIQPLILASTEVQRHRSIVLTPAEPKQLIDPGGGFTAELPGNVFDAMPPGHEIPRPYPAEEVVAALLRKDGSQMPVMARRGEMSNGTGEYGLLIDIPATQPGDSLLIVIRRHKDAGPTFGKGATVTLSPSGSN